MARPDVLTPVLKAKRDCQCEAGGTAPLGRMAASTSKAWARALAGGLQRPWGRVAHNCRRAQLCKLAKDA